MNKMYAMRMPERPSDERMEKAPNWIKEYVSRLESQAQEAIERYESLMGTQEVTRVIAGRVWDAPTYVPNGETGREQQVMLDLTSPERFDRLKDGDRYSARDYLLLTVDRDRGDGPDDLMSVNVQASHQVSVHMSASNSFVLKVAK